MGKINILNDAGTNKLSLEFNGTSDGTLNTSGLINHDLINVTSAGNTVINGVSTTHTKKIVISSSSTGTNAPGFESYGLNISTNALTTSSNYSTTFLGLENRDPRLNGSHGTSSYIALTTNNQSQGSYGAGELNFYIRNDVKYTYPNNPDAPSSYWMPSLLKIYSNGCVNMPAQPSFWAHTSSNIAAAYTPVVFTSTDLNNGGHYSTSTGRFTAPVAGIYEFSFMALFRKNGTSDSGEISFLKNGANINGRGIVYGGSGASDTAHFPLHALYRVQLSAGDYIQPYIDQKGGTTSDMYLGSKLSWFTGRLIG